MEVKEYPPIVNYIVRSVEDRAASIEAGHYVARDVDFVQVLPRGGKDKVEKVYSTWIAEQEILARDGRVNPDWVARYKSAYTAWKQGQEIPEEGTPLRTWPVASPSQIATCQALGLNTVEQLADCTTEAVSRMGMGGLTLKQRAQKWLKEANDSGKLLLALEQSNQQKELLAARNAELEERVRVLEAKAGVESPAKHEDKQIFTI